MSSKVGYAVAAGNQLENGIWTLLSLGTRLYYLWSYFICVIVGQTVKGIGIRILATSIKR